MTALQDITGRRDGIACGITRVIGVVRSVDRLPVDLCGLVVARLPEVHEVVVCIFVHRRTNEVAVIANETGAEVTAVQVLADEQTPGVVISVLVIELILGMLGVRVRVSDLAVPHERRQIAVVVWARIRCVVEVNRRVRVERVVIADSCMEVLVLIDLVLEGSNERRVVRLHDTRVAHLAVLVAPIGVIINRTGEVIHLLRHGGVLTALGRSTEGDQFQRGVTPHLLYRQEITERVVLDTFADDTFMVDIRGETVSQLRDDGPSVGHHSAGIGRVHTGLVVTVRTRYTYFPSGCIQVRSHQVVRRTGDTAEGEVTCLHRVQHLFVAAGVVQTSHSGEVEVTAFLRVEVQTFDVVVLYVRLVTTVAVTRAGPCERSRGVEHIRRSRRRGCLGLRTTFIVRHLFFREVQKNLLLRQRNHIRTHEYVLHVIDLVLLQVNQLERSHITVSFYDHLFVRRLQVTEHKLTVHIGGSRDVLVSERYFGTDNRLVGVVGNHASPESGLDIRFLHPFLRLLRYHGRCLFRLLCNSRNFLFRLLNHNGCLLLRLLRNNRRCLFGLLHNSRTFFAYSGDVCRC